MTEIEVFNVIRNGLASNSKVLVLGVCQNARTGKPESVGAAVTKCGDSCFYVGSKRLRPYLDLTEARIVMGNRPIRRYRTRSNR